MTTSYNVVGIIFLLLPFALMGFARYGLGKRKVPAPLFMAAVFVVVCFVTGVATGVATSQPLVWDSVVYGLRLVLIVPIVIALFLGFASR